MLNIIRLNRIISRIALVETLRVMLYLDRGISLEDTVTIITAYTVGYVIYNLIISKVPMSLKNGMIVANIFKLAYFSIMFRTSNLWLFTFGSLLAGAADSMTTVAGSAYCYQAFKDKYTEEMCKVSTYSLIMLMTTNYIASYNTPESIMIAGIIICTVQSISLITAFMLPNIEKTEVSSSKVDKAKLLRNRELMSNCCLFVLVKLYIVLVVKVKPYIIVGAVSEKFAQFRGYVDTTVQASAFFSPYVAKKKYSSRTMIKVFGLLMLVVTAVAANIPPLLLLPVLFVTPISSVVLFNSLTQDIGDAIDNKADLAYVLNKVDMVTNISLIIFLRILKIVYETKPFYYAYYIAIPLLVLIFIILQRKQESVNLSPVTDSRDIG